MLEISLPYLAEETIEEFIRSFIGNKKAVIAISGGIDSALVTMLASRSIKKENIMAFHMPDQENDPQDELDAESLCNELGIKFNVIKLDPFLEPFKKMYQDRMILGNIKARLRMVIIYSIANKENAFVVGSSNKTELLTGYFTKYGDGAADLYPIGDLYKTQVRQLARIVSLPEKFIEKVPTAGLWKGQTDEGELGIKYEILDKILYGIEQFMSDEQISDELKISIDTIKSIRQRIEKTKHKRVLLYIPKLGIRTVGLDFRE
ncbi:MAG: NAD+ synthase [Thermoplasmata archaeon]|nr:NAD+ synthase [Thermoplasmata archaeon]